MEKDCGMKVNNLGVDGGGVKNNFTMELEGDLLKLGVERGEINERRGLGAAY
ncbi:FGGY-family carbohydrate kinase, partial [Staphylococcus saprophyticus]|uniref:FGGY-family carbohydrate kinase n=1 Tax=Staphylococcus saprophyticus TaxID=29385 RepID=UPI0021B2B586